MAETSKLTRETDDVVVIAVDIDQHEDEQAVRDYIERNDFAGIVLLTGYKPKRKVRPNRIANPYLAAFAYGFFFGAIVIPCNPAIIAAFFARVATTTDAVANILLFTAFTLGICAPLIAFSLASLAASRWMVNALVTYERQISVGAGLTMVGVALYYLIVVFAVFVQEPVTATMIKTSLLSGQKAVFWGRVNLTCKLSLSNQTGLPNSKCGVNYMVIFRRSSHISTIS